MCAKSLLELTPDVQEHNEANEEQAQDEHRGRAAVERGCGGEQLACVSGGDRKLITRAKRTRSTARQRETKTLRSARQVSCQSVSSGCAARSERNRGSVWGTGINAHLDAGCIVSVELQDPRALCHRVCHRARVAVRPRLPTRSPRAAALAAGYALRSVRRLTPRCELRVCRGARRHLISAARGWEGSES